METIRVSNPSNHTKMIAHRGLSGLAPENTMPAFHLAAEHGYYGVECDIHVLKDGTFAIFHDHNLERMAGNKVLINELSAIDLKDYPIMNGNNIEKYHNIKIPLLNELFELCDKTNIVPTVEIKQVQNNLDLDRVVELAREYNLYNKVIFISFNLDYLLYLRKKNPDLQIQYLFNEITDEIIKICTTYKLDVDVNKTKLTKEQIELCHRHNLIVNTWTVDDKDLCQFFIDHQIDYITTNILNDK